MSVKLNLGESCYTPEYVFWDRDSFFLDFNGYWSRLIATIAQKAAENTSENWSGFNLIRTRTIKLLGVNIENGMAEDAAPVNLLALNVFPSLLATGLRELVPKYDLSNLTELLKGVLDKAVNECQTYIKSSIDYENIKVVKNIGKNAKQVLVTNDSSESNQFFLRNAGVENSFYRTLVQMNKEYIDDFSNLNLRSVFITGNNYLFNSYINRKINDVLLVKDLKLIDYTFFDASDSVIQVNIDGASRGNPGPSAIGVIFYKNNEPIHELSEFIGIQTNNFAEYSALIKALESSVERGYKDIEILSDSELVVKQINKLYKVKDADIKELFDRATELIKKIPSVRVIHVPREKNLKADKLANNALKQNT